VVDGAEIALEAVSPLATPAGATRTDGGGFYGRVGLTPGEYRLLVTPLAEGQRRSTCTVTITPGVVATVNLTIDAGAPFTASCH
jgi:hypothetical protein